MEPRSAHVVTGSRRAYPVRVRVSVRTVAARERYWTGRIVHQQARPNECKTGLLTIRSDRVGKRCIWRMVFASVFYGGVEPWARERLEVQAVREMGAKVYVILGLCRHVRTEIVWYSTVSSQLARLEITTEVVK